MTTTTTTNYSVANDASNLTILERLLAIRNVTDDRDAFLNPTYKQYRQSPAGLSDIDTGVDRIVKAITNNEKIMIFGDYDVDGITSSYIMYTVLRKYLGHHQISVRLPHRMLDGYGIKSYHIDQIHEDGCSLIITVDNGITSVQEALHAKTVGIDLVITDHHQALDTIPEAVAVINPQISDEFAFKEICGATVALKVCLAIADKLACTQTQKQAILEEYLPYVSIATIADCMPLINENRLLVKKGFAIMNNKRHTLGVGLRTLLETVGIKKVDSYTVGFKIGPMLNATGRMDSALEGLKSFLFTDPEKVREQVAYMDSLNTDRKALQQQMTLKSMEMLTGTEYVCIVADDDFHEGIGGIVAGRIAERTKKPSGVLCIKRNEGIVTGSFRSPPGFSIVEMLKSCEDILDRFGGHEQAGGVTLQLEHFDEFMMRCEAYGKEFGAVNLGESLQQVDTVVFDHERDTATLESLAQLEPYGQGNPEPLLCVEGGVVQSISTMGSGEKTHLKGSIKKGGSTVDFIRRGQGELIDQYASGTHVTLFGSIKPDTYRGGVYFGVKQMVAIVV